jgi:hypothetical protein
VDNVQNAMNVGVGVSYDLSGILKNATNVKSKARLWKYKPEEIYRLHQNTSSESHRRL